MKKILICLLILAISQFSYAQESHDESAPKKQPETSAAFDWYRVFSGGGISLGYSSNTNGGNYTTNTFNIGAIPEIGYSISELFDVGLATSINYYATTSSLSASTKQHTTNTSAGVFVRVHPLENIFIQAMPEKDWSKNKIIYNDASGSYNYSSNSFLVGIGYGHRIIGKSYFYTLLMLDLARERNSPYVDYTTGNPIPILRGGFNFYFHSRN